MRDIIRYLVFLAHHYSQQYRQRKVQIVQLTQVVQQIYMLALHSIPSRTKLNGNLLAQNILTTLKSQVMALPYNLRLAVLVMEGNENQYASSSYFKKKSEIAHQLGIKVQHLRYRRNDLNSMIQDIRKINRDPNFHGIAVHLPLPKSINPWDVLDNISVDKDVDAVTRKNLAEVERLGQRARVIPCVSRAVLYTCDRYSIDLRNKRTVVLGTSPHLGLPLAHILRQRGANISSFDEHSDPHRLKQAVKEADIAVSATGKSHLINDVKRDAILFDIGVSRRAGDKRLFGDIDEQALADYRLYTPPRGGLGPLTSVMIFWNLLKCAKGRFKLFE